MFVRTPTRVFAPDGGGAAPPPQAALAAAAPPAAAPPAAAPPAAAPPAFAESLPEDIRGEAAFRDIRDLPTLAKGYLNAQKLLGHRPEHLVVVPGSDDAAAWESVYGKLGRPDKADNYAFKPAEGVTPDAKLLGGFQAAAFKAGLSQRQAEQLFGWWNGAAGESAQAGQQAAAAAQEAGIAALRTEWGAAFDTKLALAKRALDHFGGAKLQAEIDRTGMGNSPELARVLAKMGTQLAEDGVIGRNGDAGGGLKSPGEAKQEINALRADKAFVAIYTDKRNPGHADAVARMQRLHEMAFPPG